MKGSELFNINIKVVDGKIYDWFSYLFNNLIFSIFLKEERDWELIDDLIVKWIKKLNYIILEKGKNFFRF